MKAAIFSVLALAALSSTARAELRLETLDGSPDELVYHLRLESPKTSELKFSLVWNHSQPLQRGRLDVRATPANQSDELLGGAIAYELWQGDSLVERGRCRSDHSSAADRGLSAVLTYNSSGSFIRLGDSAPKVSLPISFEPEAGQTFGYDAPEKIKVIRNDIRATLRAEREFAPFSDLEALMRYIDASRDPREKVWRYLDRNTDPRKTEPGGQYTLATVSDGRGGYMLVYIGGATYAQGEWQPLQIKGRLTPTAFRDHFNLVWYDSRRRVISAETSASITTSGTILELNFPLLGSSLRFSR